MEVHVCTHQSCSRRGAQELLRDIEELAAGRCEVGPRNCMPQYCDEGPFIVYRKSNGKQKRMHKVNNFKKIEHVIAKELGLEVTPFTHKVAKLKYSVRREPEAIKKEQLLEQGFQMLGAASKKEPRLLAELLVLRSQEQLQSRGRAAEALADAQKAVELVPGWPEARLKEASALEALGRVVEALVAMDLALEGGQGVDTNNVSAQRTRLVRAVEKDKQHKKDLQEQIRVSDANEAFALGSNRRASKDGPPLLGKKMAPLPGMQNQTKLAANTKAKPAAKSSSQVDAKTVIAEPPAEGQGQSVEEISGEVLAKGVTGGEVATAAAAALVAQNSQPKSAQPKSPSQPQSKNRKLSSDVVERTTRGNGQEERRAIEKSEATPPFEKPHRNHKESLSMSVDSALAVTEDETLDWRHMPRTVEWRIDRVWWLNHNCIRIRLKSLHPERTMSTRAAPDVWHVVLVTKFTFNAGGKPFTEEITRSYTPLTTLQDYLGGRMDLMAKVYPSGKMSQYLANGGGSATVFVSPPLPILTPDAYRLAGGAVMIAGGSAVTVALQVCHQILKKNKRGYDSDSVSQERMSMETDTESICNDEFDDEPRVTLVLCNKTRRDVLFRDHFGAMLEQYPSFNLVHCISSGPVVQEAGERILWRSGHVNAEVLRPAAEAGLKAIVSGPPGLCKKALQVWVALGRDERDLKILDELPDENDLTTEPKAAPRRQPSAARRERRERAWRGNVKGKVKRGNSVDSSGALFLDNESPECVDLSEAQGLTVAIQKVEDAVQPEFSIFSRLWSTLVPSFPSCGNCGTHQKGGAKSEGLGREEEDAVQDITLEP